MNSILNSFHVYKSLNYGRNDPNEIKYCISLFEILGVDVRENIFSLHFKNFEIKKIKRPFILKLFNCNL